MGEDTEGSTTSFAKAVTVHSAFVTINIIFGPRVSTHKRQLIARFYAARAAATVAASAAERPTAIRDFTAAAVTNGDREERSTVETRRDRSRLRLAIV